MTDQFASLKIRKTVKSRLDLLKKNSTYTDILDSMIVYFEISGIDPKSGQTPPAQTIIKVLNENFSHVNKRIEDFIKIIRNIENKKIDYIMDALQAFSGSIELDSQTLGDENIQKMLDTIELLRSQLKEKEKELSKLKAQKEKYIYITAEVLETVKELLSDDILDHDSKTNYLLLSPNHREQLIAKIKTICNV